MKELNLNAYDPSCFGRNVHIKCEDFVHEGVFSIKDNVEVHAKNIYIGRNAIIDENTKVGALTGDMESFCIGDESYIGPNAQIKTPKFWMGDYTKIFHYTLCSGYEPITLGHNCWVGQSSILNSVCELSIGNNVRMGGNSQIWTHVASGELLEGCRFYGQRPVVIEDNVWLMGFGHSVSPGVTLARNSIITAGSVITKSTEPYHTYSGAPAIDITKKLKGWNDVNLDMKYKMLEGFVDEFISQNNDHKEKVFCFDLMIDDDCLAFERVLKLPYHCLFFLKQTVKPEDYLNVIHSVFDLTSKMYLKKRTDIEVEWMKFSVGHRARFIPFGDG